MLSREGLIVLRHYMKEGLTKKGIAARLGISRRTVHRYLASGKAEPSYGPRPRRPSKLDPYKAYLGARMGVYPELSAVRLLGEIQALGYRGKYTVVKDYVRSLKPQLPLPIEHRFEVKPGHQAQVDFASFKTSFGAVSALLVVLSWSRVLWVRFFLHQDELTVLGGLHRAFQAFGGVPGTVLFDRMRTAVIGSDAGGAAVFNAELLRFAAHCGFRPVACRPYRAKTKGRVERAVGYLRQAFFYGRTFRDLDDLNAQVEAWLMETANARVHGTTQAAPKARLNEERPHLLPLPATPYIPMITLGRRVSHDGFISYNGNDYSVPEGVGRAEVEVRATLEEVYLLQDGKLLARHPVLEGRGQRRLAPVHRRPRVPQGTLLPSRPDLIAELIDVQRRPLEVYEQVLR